MGLETDIHILKRHSILKSFTSFTWNFRCFVKERQSIFSVNFAEFFIKAFFAKYVHVTTTQGNFHISFRESLTSLGKYYLFKGRLGTRLCFHIIFLLLGNSSGHLFTRFIYLITISSYLWQIKSVLKPGKIPRCYDIDNSPFYTKK